MNEPKAKRRQWREKRGNALRQMHSGVLDNLPLKERWTREGKKEAKRKKLKPLAENFLEEQKERALVLSVHRRSCRVRLESGKEIKAFYLAKSIEEAKEFPAVGDFVIIAENFIISIEPRKSALTRPGPRTRENQTLVQAANIDQVAIVMSLESPPFNFGFADRFLLAANFNNLPFILILNKSDLIKKIPEEIQEFIKLADNTILTNILGTGIKELKNKLKGKVSVFSGQSGVGKSSLINMLVPNALQDVGEVRKKDGKGRHTTVASAYLDLPGGGAVIDTPGIRALGIMNLTADELARCFPGFFENDVFDCKFKDCKHQGEPDCAVQRRIEEGKISEARYRSYLRMLRFCF
uniref:Small ribosomal subunit biogenesis GTPase RsgA n=1 Tax=uncultured bacterium contig00029 TaxID=1181518 RepID=A0A806KGI5_9BACT|nr:ribosome small subunit-stimulated GTPase EngC [uncultured bacterium contig00029]